MRRSLRARARQDLGKRQRAAVGQREPHAARGAVDEGRVDSLAPDTGEMHLDRLHRRALPRAPAVVVRGRVAGVRAATRA